MASPLFPGIRSEGDFDGDQCSGLGDFLYLIDYWQAAPPEGGAPYGMADFLAIIDNWNTGAGCN